MATESTRARINLNVNGQAHDLDIEYRESLLDVLRERLDLTGAKRACDRGECGACTVLIDDKPMLACNLLAVQARGRAVTTVEGLAQRPDFSRVLDAFIAEDGGQCGFCVPGFAVAAYAALHRPGPVEGQHETTLDATALRWELVGHTCRCNAYDRIAAAVNASVNPP
jgi:xanthine dehydrogenase YagT iron-sulfur-binding subunit